MSKKMFLRPGQQIWAAALKARGMPGSSPALLATLHSLRSQWQTIYGNLTQPKYIYKTCKKRFFQSEDRPEIVTNQPKELQQKTKSSCQ